MHENLPWHELFNFMCRNFSPQFECMKIFEFKSVHVQIDLGNWPEMDCSIIVVGTSKFVFTNNGVAVLVKVCNTMVSGNKDRYIYRVSTHPRVSKMVAVKYWPVSTGSFLWRPFSGCFIAWGGESCRLEMPVIIAWPLLTGSTVCFSVFSNQWVYDNSLLLRSSGNPSAATIQGSHCNTQPRCKCVWQPLSNCVCKYVTDPIKNNTPSVDWPQDNLSTRDW